MRPDCGLLLATGPVERRDIYIRSGSVAGEAWYYASWNLGHFTVGSHRLDFLMNLLPNFIELRPQDLDRPIYRIFSIQRFLELVTTNQNTLVRPALWDDPFENFILKSVAQLSDSLRVSIAFKDQLYGQCWTFQRDSDAMWRIYSPDKQGVRVRTTIRQLYDSLLGTCKRFPELSCFIGKVRYLPQKDILRQLEEAAHVTAGILDPTGCGQATTLLIKRKEFRHEQEVRLIYFCQDKDFTSDIYQYHIRPVELFDEIALDPRLSDELTDVFVRHIQALGFQKNAVIRSSLYRLPALQLRLESV